MRILSILIISTVALFATHAFAQGARAHFRSGQSYYTQGRYEKAIDEFEEAYKLDAKPLLLYNIAQSYEKLGELAQAVEYLRRYLKEDPNTDSRASLENKIKVLEQRIASTGISVKANVDGATIYVDDKSMGTTPLNSVIPVAEGTHKVRISKEGYRDFIMQVATSLGHSVPVEATLEPQEDTAVPADPVVKDSAAEEQPVEDKKKLEPLDVVPWVIAGVGAATAITGLGVLGGIANSKDDHDLAVVADAVGWPGLALAIGGGIWGVIRLIKKKPAESNAVETDDTAFVIVPFADHTRLGVAATITF